MNFFIKQNSTRSPIKFPLKKWIMDKYDITNEMMENVAVTFSMVNEKGNYIIANSSGDLIINENLDVDLDETEFTLSYYMNKYDTMVSGRYEGEFKLDFLGEYCGVITLPVNNRINININKSITKTDVIS